MFRQMETKKNRATLVALYGKKPESAVRYFTALQRLLAELGDAFTPYEMAQVHATIIGLEGLRMQPSDTIVNANFLECRGERREMQLAKVLEIANSASWLPLQVQLGGFSEVAQYPFLSRGEHPAQRSFSAQGCNAVAIGWPSVTGAYPPVLGRVRRAFEDAGVLHKYHRAANAIDDNDFFFVLGKIEACRTTQDFLLSVTTDVRDFMAQHAIGLCVDARNLQVVHYSDPALPVSSSTPYPLLELNVQQLEQMYRTDFRL